MPYKIEVVGNTIQELFQETVNLAIVMGQGGNTALRPPATALAEKPVSVPDEAVETVHPPQTPGVETGKNPEVAPLPAEKRKPGRPPKPVTIEATATTETEMAKSFTLKEDIQPRIRDIMDNFKARHGAPADDREDQILIGKGVNYALQLLKKYGAKNTREVKPEQFADFMRDSEAYLDGSAEVVS